MLVASSLWNNAEATEPNLRGPLLAHPSKAFERPVTAEDLFAYIAAVAAHPACVERFRSDLATPGLRIPLTADADTFFEAAALGRRIGGLHTFGERFADVAAGRQPGAPRSPVGRRPQVPKGGAIPTTVEGMPDTLAHDAGKKRLMVGRGYIEPVPPAVRHYQVSGKQVLVQWFSYRKKHRERPIIGDRRKPSELGDIQPDHWLAEYTTELLNVMNVLGLLVSQDVVVYTQGLTLAVWQADAMRVDATLRKLSLIGEAATRVPDGIRLQAPGIPWRKIVGLRNRLMHAYPATDDSAIRSIVTGDVPTLRASLKALLVLLPPSPVI